MTRTLVAALLWLLAGVPAQAQTETTTVTAGSTPLGVAVNPVTNKIYLANSGSASVTVIDGATNSTTTVSVGTNPGAVAVNPVTNKIYVVNQGSDNVTVIDGGTNNTTTVDVGSSPQGVAVNPVTNKIYVSNWKSNNVTVIDGVTNNTTTVSAGALPKGIATLLPYAVAVNPVTNEIYVTNQYSGTVLVIDGVTNNTTSVNVGVDPQAVAVNPVTNKIYVANNGSQSVTVIDGNTNTVVTTINTAIAGAYVESGYPYAVAVNPVTNMIYVANFYSYEVTVIDGATNKATDVYIKAFYSRDPNALAVNPVTNKIYITSGGGYLTVMDGATNNFATLSAPAGPAAVAVNPVTNKIYVTGLWTDGGLGTPNVQVYDGATNNTTTVSAGTGPLAVAANPVTNKIYVANQGSDNVTVIDGATGNTTTVSVGTNPLAVAVNPVTNKIYVANYSSDNVTVIDGATGNTTTVSAGTNPLAVAVNPVTNKIYVANQNSNNVTVIDGATNDTTTVSAGTNPSAVAVNPATNLIYVANWGSDSVTVIDGATNSTITFSAGTNPIAVAVDPVTSWLYVANFNSANVTAIMCATINAGGYPAATINVGTYPNAVAVNPMTHNIYVPNYGSGNVTVIANNTTTLSAGMERVTNALPPAFTTTTVSAGMEPYAVAVNPVTNKIYISNGGNDNNVTVIDGATNSTSTVSTGKLPAGLAVNPMTNTIYIANYNSDDVTALAEQQVQAIPLTVDITPLANNVTDVSTPNFNFTASNSLTNIAVDNLLYRIDNWQGPWTVATSQGEGAFSGPTSTLQPGFHTLYAYATEGEETTPSSFGQSAGGEAGGPLIGTMAAYIFLVAPPLANTFPSSLNFGNQAVGSTSSPQTLTLSNEGGSTLNFSLSISGPNAGDFSELGTGTCNTLSGQLPANSFCTISITFTPSATGTLTATLTITDNTNGVADSTQSVSLTGTGLTAIAVSLSPATASVALGGTQLFTATITDTTNTALNWYVNGVLNGNATQGTLTACTTTAPLTCTYTAPPVNVPSPNPAVIKVVSVADTTKYQTANVTVTDSIALTLKPSSASVALGGTQVFTATISNTTNTALNWYVNGVLNGNSAQGTLTACTKAAPWQCTYTAPAAAVPNPNPAVIEVASVADPTKYQTANVTVTDTIAVTLSPSSASVPLGGRELFMATVSNTTNNSLKWYVNGVLNGNSTQGTLGICLASAGGQQCLYTAPANAVPNPNPAVIEVASAADPTKYQTASVTVTTSIVMTLSPASASLALGGTQVFTVTISDSSNSALNWYVNLWQNGSSAQGTLTACTKVPPWTCTYTAPPVNVPNPNPAVIKVVSVAHPSIYQTANVTVTDNIAVTLSPTSVSLPLGGTQVFTATISNTTNTALKWYVNGVLNGNSTQGTLTACTTTAPLTCTYTAPPVDVPNPNPAVIKVASVADPGKYQTANVTVTDNIAVTLSPSSASVLLGGTQLFKATISNTTNNTLKWYVNGVLNGNSTQGTLGSCLAWAGGQQCLYTAPANAVPNPNPAVIEVASAADPAKYATASVTVTDNIAVTLSPTSATVALGGTQEFTATISNTTNTDLDWYVNGVQNGNSTQGTLDSCVGIIGAGKWECKYTAPATAVPNPNPAVIKAASVADPTKYATANVTVTP